MKVQCLLENASTLVVPFFELVCFILAETRIDKGRTPLFPRPEVVKLPVTPLDLHFRM